MTAITVPAVQTYSPPFCPRAYDRAFYTVQLQNIARALVPRQTRNVMAAAMLAITDDVVTVDTTAGSVTVTCLPAAQCLNWRGTIKWAAGAHSCILAAADHLDGAASITFGSLYDCYIIQSDGATYQVLAKF
jgi:hypothetical protein